MSHFLCQWHAAHSMMNEMLWHTANRQQYEPRRTSTHTQAYVCMYWCTHIRMYVCMHELTWDRSIKGVKAHRMPCHPISGRHSYENIHTLTHEFIHSIARSFIHSYVGAHSVTFNVFKGRQRRAAGGLRTAAKWSRGK